jgi:hypothetical protein
LPTLASADINPGFKTSTPSLLPEVDSKNLLRCLLYGDSLSIAADELQDRLPAFTPRPANERNVYVIGLRRAKTGTSDPEAYRHSSP